MQGLDPNGPMGADTQPSALTHRLLWHRAADLCGEVVSLICTKVLLGLGKVLAALYLRALGLSIVRLHQGEYKLHQGSDGACHPSPPCTRPGEDDLHGPPQ